MHRIPYMPPPPPPEGSAESRCSLRGLGVLLLLMILFWVGVFVWLTS